MRRYWNLAVVVAGLVGLLGLAGLPLAAADVSGAVTQSYSADSSVLPGMVVALAAHSQTTVTPLNASAIHDMVGVVVPVNDAPIVLTPQSASAQQVLVAGSGRYNLLVSNQNGPVSAGDYLAVSALPGIAMKAGADQSEIVGQASAGFDGNSNVLGSMPLKSSVGHSMTVSIGDVPTAIRLAPNPLFQDNSKVSGFLSKLASGVANKNVSPVRVYLSSAVVVAVLFIFGIMLYGGVRNGIVAIGRNPLAKKAIGRGLLQTFIAGLIIFVAGIFAAYLILI